MSSNSLVLNFAQIDDHVTAHVNGEPVYEHGILRHGQPPQQVDLTERLRNGRNELRVTAYNGPGSATLIGDITYKGQVVSQWKVLTQSTGPGVFLEETIAIMFHA